MSTRDIHTSSHLAQHQTNAYHPTSQDQAIKAPHVSTRPSSSNQIKDVILDNKVPPSHNPSSPHILSSVLIETNTPPNNPSPLSTWSPTSIPPNIRSTRFTSITSIGPTRVLGCGSWKDIESQGTCQCAECWRGGREEVDG